MFEVGSWRIAEKDNCFVVLDISGGSAYVYLWDKGEGVLSHVWLFNCVTQKSKIDGVNDNGSPMPEENIDWHLYFAPSNIDEISCVYCEKSSTWDISWAGKKIAEISDQFIPGRSIFVKVKSQMAVPFSTVTSTANKID